jgi:hypothetical protein
MKPHPSGRPVRKEVRKRYGTERSYWSEPLTPRLRKPAGFVADAVSSIYSSPAEGWDGSWAKDKPGFIHFKE